MTVRQQQIAMLLAEGLTNREIAERLFITERSAEGHVERIRNRLGFTSRAQIAAWVTRWTLEALPAHTGAASAQPPASVFGNLPAQLTTFVGRGDQVTALVDAIGRNRLVTLTGPGGIGKTRLALEVAARSRPHHPDGVWWVDLGQVSDGAAVVPAIRGAMQLSAPGRGGAAAIVDEIGRGRLCLVLDGCEHLVAPVASLVADLLASCPGLHLLITSRERLRMSGEVVWPVPPLSCPAAVVSRFKDLGRSESVRLFLERASLGQPDLRLSKENAPAICELCHRLEGLPLAIELAASWVGALTPTEILDRMKDRFLLLSLGDRGAALRHRTLEAAIDWSYDLLGPEEQQLFEFVSVAVGGFDLAFAEAMQPNEGTPGRSVDGVIRSLVDKSLLVVNTDGTTTRFGMLDTLREYGLRRLGDRGEEDEARQRHADHFLRFAEEASQRLLGPDEVHWFHRLDQELDNLRLALAWFSDRAVEPLCRLVAALGWFWSQRGHVDEALLWTERARTNSLPGSALRASVLVAACCASAFAGDFGRARAHGDEAVAIYSRLEDIPGIAAASVWLGWVFLLEGRFTEAERHLRRTAAFAPEATAMPYACFAISRLGQIAWRQGDLDTARNWWDKGLELADRLGSPTLGSTMLDNLGRMAHRLGDLDRAESCYEQALRLEQALGNRGTVVWLHSALAQVALDRGDLPLAVIRLQEALELARHPGSGFLPHPLEAAARLAMVQGQQERTLVLAAAASSVRRDIRTGLAYIFADKLDLALVRSQLAPEEVSAAESKGASMSKSDAIEYARSGLSPQVARRQRGRQ